MKLLGKKEKVEKAPKKRKQIEKEPAYYKSATNIPTINYKVYYMSKKEKILYFLLAFVVGAVVGYLFYGGIGSDEYGNPTQITYILNVVIPGITGIIAGRLFLPVRTNQIIDKRNKQLKHQFRDFLDGIATSLGSGNNMMNSVVNVYDDLKVQYNKEDYIVQEMEVLVKGMNNNVPLEEMFMDLGNRSGNVDIKSFAEVFEISYRKGGNIQEIIKNTHKVLDEKLEITDDIETIVSTNKMEQSVMIMMPVVLIAAIKGMSPEFAQNFKTPSGIIATTFALICFVAAYFLSKLILDIKL